jgi:hypothetical protein
LNTVMMNIKRNLFRYRFHRSKLTFVTKCTQNRIFQNKNGSVFFRNPIISFSKHFFL